MGTACEVEQLGDAVNQVARLRLAIDSQKPGGGVDVLRADYSRAVGRVRALVLRIADAGL